MSANNLKMLLLSTSSVAKYRCHFYVRSGNAKMFPCRQMVQIAVVENERLKPSEEKLSKSLQKYLLSLSLVPKLDGQVRYFYGFVLLLFFTTVLGAMYFLIIAETIQLVLFAKWVHTCRAVHIHPVTGISIFFTWWTMIAYNDYFISLYKYLDKLYMIQLKVNWIILCKTID